MKTIRVSATHARNNFFELLNLVSTGSEVVVEKVRRMAAKIVPVKSTPRNKGLLKALDRAAKGFVYDEKDNPLRRPGAADFLGKWDK